MKKILFLSSLNLNRRDGGALATLAYYNALCQLYPNRIDLAMPEEDCVGNFSNSIAIPRRSVSELLYGFSIHRGYKFIKDFIKEHGREYAVCVINISRTAGDLMDCFHKEGIKIVVIHHNYEVEYTMENKHICTIKGLTPFFVRKIEGNAYRESDINCFLTDSDMKSLENAYGKTKALNYVLGVFEKEPYNYSITKSDDKNIMIFTGSMCDYQTYHSAELFEKKYLNMMLRSCPDIKLIISGRNPHRSIWNIQKKYPDSVEVIPNPEDIDEVLDNASIFLCPTCLGSGIKLRIMDGLKKGMPVLAHKSSARGYEKFHSKPYFQVYDDENSFMNGLSSIRNYMSNNVNYREEIQNQYFEYFGFISGMKRMKMVFDNLSL